MPEASRVCLGRKSLAGLRQKVIRIRAVDAGFIKTPIAWRDEVKQRGVIRIPKGRSKTYPCHVIYYPWMPANLLLLLLPFFPSPCSMTRSFDCLTNLKIDAPPSIMDAILYLYIDFQFRIESTVFYL